MMNEMLNNQTQGNVNSIVEASIQGKGNNNGSVNAERKVAKIVMDEHEVFDPDTQGKLINSAELAGVISNLFRTVFNDYKGCSISNETVTAPNGAKMSVPAAKIYFKYNPNGSNEKYTALVPTRGQQTQMSNNVDPAIAFLQGQAAARISSTFRLSQEAMDILTPMVYSARNKKVNWNDFVKEINTPQWNVNMYESVLVEVSGINIDYLLGLIYGTDEVVSLGNGNKEKNTYQYKYSILSAMNTAGQYGGPAAQIYLGTIQRISTNKIEALTQKMMGAVPGSNVVMY